MPQLRSLSFNNMTMEENPWLGLSALLTVCRGTFMTESTEEVKPNSAFPSASIITQQKFVPANINLSNETSTVHLIALLLGYCECT